MKKSHIPLILVLCFISCGGKVDQAGLYCYNFKDPFMRKYVDQVIQFSESRFSLAAYDAQNSQIIQNEQIENMIRSRGSLMLINPVDRLGVYPIIKKARRLNIPIIFFNREPLIEDLELWDRVYYIGARAAQSGQMQAQLVMDLFGGDPAHLNSYDRNGDGKIQAVILKGEQGHQDAEIRTTEVMEYFQDHGFVLDILVTEIANWSKDQASEKMDGILRQFGHSLELVISNNDAMAIGAIEKMRQAGMFQDTNGNGKIDKSDGKWIPVVGIDGIEEAVRNIESGYLYATVLNDSENQARALVELADCILGGKPLSDYSYPITDGKYILIDYKTFTLQ